MVKAISQAGVEEGTCALGSSRGTAIFSEMPVLSVSAVHGMPPSSPSDHPPAYELRLPFKLRAEAGKGLSGPSLHTPWGLSRLPQEEIYKLGS